jgi:hypothetical protein
MLKHVGLITSFLFFLTLSLFAEDQNFNKLYCSPEQIELTDSMILVHLKQNTFEIDQLLVDQGGIYFQEEAMRCYYCRRTLNPKNTCECPIR